MSKSAIVIGASSGIGLALAKLLSARGYRLGLAARRLELLDAHASGDPGVQLVRRMDLVDPGSVGILQEMIATMGGVDLVIISSGTGHLNADLSWEPEAETIETNVSGFARLAVAAMHIFEKQGRGHLVGISSVAALRGAAEAPAYGASKAFMSRYLQALAFRAKRSSLPIRVTDVRPGFVDTPMMKADKPFWVASPDKAAQQIMDGVERGKRILYVSRRWSLIGWLLRHLPE